MPVMSVEAAMQLAFDETRALRRVVAALVHRLSLDGRLDREELVADIRAVHHESDTEGMLTEVESLIAEIEGYTALTVVSDSGKN